MSDERGRADKLRRVAAIAAALVACETGADPGALAVRVRTVWPEAGPWTWIGRREQMQGQGGGRW